MSSATQAWYAAQLRHVARLDARIAELTAERDAVLASMPGSDDPHAILDSLPRDPDAAWHQVELLLALGTRKPRTTRRRPA